MKRNFKLIRNRMQQVQIKIKSKATFFEVSCLLSFGYWGVGATLGPLGTAATPGLFCLFRVIVRMEKLVE
jgi:hypothetical protein